MKNLTPTQTECLALLEKTAFVDLTTLDADGYPSSRAMMNLRCKETTPALADVHAEAANPLTIYFTTNTSSAKMREIAKSPKAAVYFYDAATFKGYLLQGVVENVTNEALKKRIWQPGWETYYPAGWEDFSVLKFTPARMKAYGNFSVTEENV